MGRTFNKEQIRLLAEIGIIRGVSQTKFEPRRAITRAEYTSLLVRLG
ncbi:S-layer homology domain-containing protein [Paenibacillus sp. 481]|nr:S-layer homology domain-containing protein [Paenibacillus sp. 481]